MVCASYFIDAATPPVQRSAARPGLDETAPRGALRPRHRADLSP
jgi:hypothetical protein